MSDDDDDGGDEDRVNVFEIDLDNHDDDDVETLLNSALTSDAAHNLTLNSASFHLFDVLSSCPTLLTSSTCQTRSYLSFLRPQRPDLFVFDDNTNQCADLCLESLWLASDSSLYSQVVTTSC